MFSEMYRILAHISTCKYNWTCKKVFEYIYSKSIWTKLVILTAVKPTMIHVLRAFFVGQICEVTRSEIIFWYIFRMSIWFLKHFIGGFLYKWHFILTIWQGYGSGKPCWHDWDEIMLVQSLATSTDPIQCLHTLVHFAPQEQELWRGVKRIKVNEEGGVCSEQGGQGLYFCVLQQLGTWVNLSMNSQCMVAFDKAFNYCKTSNFPGTNSLCVLHEDGILWHSIFAFGCILQIFSLILFKTCKYIYRSNINEVTVIYHQRMPQLR